MYICLKRGREGRRKKAEKETEKRERERGREKEGTFRRIKTETRSHT